MKGIGTPISTYSPTFVARGEMTMQVIGCQFYIAWENKIASCFPVHCYDLRFPEIFRHQTRLGAQVLIVIANWPGSPRCTLANAGKLQPAYTFLILICGNPRRRVLSWASLIDS
jgi:hypothetical protein